MKYTYKKRYPVYSAKKLDQMVQEDISWLIANLGTSVGRHARWNWGDDLFDNNDQFQRCYYFRDLEDHALFVLSCGQ